MTYEDIVTDAGLSVGGSFASCESAEEWLRAHDADVAIIERLQDGSTPDIPLLTAGNNVLCPRSAPSTKRFIRSPANRVKIISRESHQTEHFHTAWTFSGHRPPARDIMMAKIVNGKIH